MKAPASVNPKDLDIRYDLALARWDPLPQVPPLSWLDPSPADRPGSHPPGRIALSRWILASLIGLLPPSLFSLLPSSFFGGQFLAPAGTAKDLYHFYAQIAFYPALLLIILYGRRALGDMLNTLDAVYGTQIPSISRPHSKLLRALGWLTTLTKGRFLFWSLFFLTVNALAYHQRMLAPRQEWLTSPASPGTLLYFAHIGNVQPNLAGLSAQLLSGLPVGLAIVVIARLTIQFATACAQVSHAVDGHIIPGHPDSTGGLLPVGRMSLLFTIPLMLIALGQTIIVIQEVNIWHRPVPRDQITYTIIFMALAPLFFFLPLIPLRQVMQQAKHKCLVSLRAIYRSNESTAKLADGQKELDVTAIGNQIALGDLLQRVTDMSVWPLDRKTLGRFVGYVISPLLPLIVSALMRRWFHLE